MKSDDNQERSARSYNMSRIRGKDTNPELIVRRWLWSHGYRYRLNHPRLPGKPDIVLRKYRTCIFVNGCFWHGHEGCRYYTIPKTHTEFWTQKVSRNQERDAVVIEKLAAMHWRTITIWECQLKPAVCEDTLRALEYRLNQAYLQDQGAHIPSPIILSDEEEITSYDLPEETPSLIAAEDILPYGED